ncbi:extracellular solute-binding protein [Paenibacillus sp. Marseille-Q4541]|uniref:extracellular solute-binding protein n=1 Tax=Paenibacillus sp. Marseille-Q4541 TaxID=2831522 RepID=UPI001BA5EE09|nr:extracellular solute-binding protein [Paenibacillus sp. Marseille-Q4541]
MRKSKSTLSYSVKMVSTAFLVTSLLAACSPGGEQNSAESGTQKSPDSKSQISIMVPNFAAETPADNNAVLQKLEELTDTDVEFQWVPSSSYDDKFNITLASGKLPSVMVVLGKTPSFINAARSGAFWELGPYLKDYPNLSGANEIILNNASIDGKTYGIYRARALGRNGVSIRKDWLDHLGLEAPTTIDEFYKVMKAFTENDPDGNGKKDTYGLIASKFNGPWDIMQVWFGAPNGWGEENGKLIPAHTTPEYLEALKFFRQLYAEGIVNQDFAVMDATKMTDLMVNGKGGVMVDVADNAQRVEAKILEKDPNHTDAVDVLPAMVGPEGHRDLPTSGYAGMIAISKSGVKTEEELKKVLAFLDKLNDEELQMLMSSGLEGTHYEKKDDYIVPTTDKQKLRDLNGTNQILMFIPETRGLTVEQTPLRKKVAELQKENESIVIPNPGEPLISDVYAQKGPQLDNIINDARTKFIVGQIDEKGLQDAFALWEKNGGTEYVAEVNKLYAELQK